MAELIVLGENNGIDRAALLDALGQSVIGSPVPSLQDLRTRAITTTPQPSRPTSSSRTWISPLISRTRGSLPPGDRTRQRTRQRPRRRRLRRYRFRGTLTESATLDRARHPTWRQPRDALGIHRGGDFSTAVHPHLTSYILEVHWLCEKAVICSTWWELPEREWRHRCEPCVAWRSGGPISMTNVIMPQLGETVADGTVTKWLKSLGDMVTKGEPSSKCRLTKSTRRYPRRPVVSCRRSWLMKVRPSMWAPCWPSSEATTSAPREMSRRAFVPSPQMSLRARRTPAS